jgi:hypothetical protein
MGDTKPPEPTEQLPKPSRTEEARQVVEEYAEALRTTIEKLRRKLN